MSLQVYKVIHLAGVMMIFLAYGALIARTALNTENRSFRKLGAATSGIGLFLVLLGGFGMLARLFPGAPELYLQFWIIAKLVVWLILGGLIVVANRKAEMALPLWWGLIILGVVAAYLGLFKPGLGG